MKNKKQNQCIGSFYNEVMKDRKGWKQKGKTQIHLNEKNDENGKTHNICKLLKMYVLQKKCPPKAIFRSPNFLQNSMEDNVF